MTTKYVIEQNGYYLKINNDTTGPGMRQLINKIKEATLFDTEREALLAAENYIDDSKEDCKVIELTGNEFFALMTK